MIAAMLAVLPDPAARLARLCEWLQRQPPADAVCALNDVLLQAEAHNTKAQAALLSVVNVRTALPYDRVSDLYMAADDAGLAKVKQLFVAGPVQKSPKGVADNPFLEKTLGERKAMAMSRDRDVIDRLMRDRNPQVITILLRNPRVTEQDVVRIAATPRQTQSVIETILRNHKWLQRYAVKKAIVFNAYTPRNIARNLMPALIESDRDDARRLLFSADEV